jgi:hypothetical protein
MRADAHLNLDSRGPRHAILFQKNRCFHPEYCISLVRRPIRGLEAGLSRHWVSSATRDTEHAQRWKYEMGKEGLVIADVDCLELLRVD